MKRIFLIVFFVTSPLFASLEVGLPVGQSFEEMCDFGLSRFYNNNLHVDLKGSVAELKEVLGKVEELYDSLGMYRDGEKERMGAILGEIDPNALVMFMRRNDFSDSVNSILRFVMVSDQLRVHAGLRPIREKMGILEEKYPNAKYNFPNDYIDMGGFGFFESSPKLELVSLSVDALRYFNTINQGMPNLTVVAEAVASASLLQYYLDFGFEVIEELASDRVLLEANTHSIYSRFVKPFEPAKYEVPWEGSYERALVRYLELIARDTEAMKVALDSLPDQIRNNFTFGHYSHAQLNYRAHRFEEFQRIAAGLERLDPGSAEMRAMAVRAEVTTVLDPFWSRLQQGVTPEQAVAKITELKNSPRYAFPEKWPDFLQFNPLDLFDGQIAIATGDFARARQIARKVRRERRERQGFMLLIGPNLKEYRFVSLARMIGNSRRWFEPPRENPFEQVWDSLSIIQAEDNALQPEAYLYLSESLEKAILLDEARWARNVARNLAD